MKDHRGRDLLLWSLVILSVCVILLWLGTK